MRKANFITAGLVILLITTSIFGQQHTENSKDQVLRGSGRVNPATLGMEFELPLGSYPGRGINVPVSLSYSSKLWRLEYAGTGPLPNSGYGGCVTSYQTVYGENSAAGWTNSLAFPYIEYTGKDNLFYGNGKAVGDDNYELCNPNAPPQYNEEHFIKRINIHLPSGETHELRADDTPQPLQTMNNSTWNGIYYAVDGSNIKYVEDFQNNIYRLLMPDGSYYDFAPTTIQTTVTTALSNLRTIRKAVQFSDRNGNYTTYHEPNAAFPNGYWTDTLGRNIPVPLKPEAPASPTVQTYNLPGIGGANFTYKFHWKKLKGETAAESALTDFNQTLKYQAQNYVPGDAFRNPADALFLSQQSKRVFDYTTERFNPVVLSEIELPTGQKYRFTYNIFGEIERIYYPTGGEERLEFGEVASVSRLEFPSTQTNRGIINRKVYQTAGTGAPYEWTYSTNFTSGVNLTVNTVMPDNIRTERLIHPSEGMSFGFESALGGKTYQEKVYSATGQLIANTLTNWTKTTNPNSIWGAQWHPRVASEESRIYDQLNNGVSSTAVYEYEGDLNSIETPLLAKKQTQYDFVAVGNPPPATPVRSSETTFLINDSNIPQAVRDIYKNQNMVGLATVSVVKDSAGTIVSRSEMKYDESGYSPGYRGNPTTSRVWDSTKGNWDNANAYIATRAKFDLYGNQYEAIDAKGNSTITTFDAVHHAYPVSVTTAAPDPTGQNGSNTGFTTTATFDAVTGLPLTTTDANGLETRISYDPVTLRPLNTKTFYNNVQVGAMAETIYHDEPNNYWVKSRAQIETDKWAESITYFDGLGRAYKAEEINSKGNIFVEKEFDQDGRVLRVTNPFRSGETKQWTTNVYDNASRVIEVVLPDGAKVKTDYGVSVSGVIGVTKQITDQAGKKRRSITNSLGELIRVDEPDTNGNLGAVSSPIQPTYYSYNTLGKMTRVQQGVQNRYFLYDSLGRLLRARQPEQTVNSSLNTTGNPDNNIWTTGFSYDDNGNILTATDAKNVVMNYVYDNLNRIKTRSYSDSTSQVSYKYDNLLHGKGALIEVSRSGSTSKTTVFNDLGQVLTYQQITDNQTYQTSYQYNSVGVLTSEIYPSGKQVNYEFNSDGDMSRVWGQNGNGCTSNCLKTYANSFSYNSAGAMEKLRLGNGKWETAKYNNRLQISEIGLGNGSTDASLWKTSYEYGELNTNGTIDTTKNSGNVAKQTLTFAGLTNPLIQTYKYDSLDRLSEAKETSNNQQTWIQQFGYDRYGNRTSFDQLIGAAQANATPNVDANTNRFQTGEGYIYDLNGNLIQDAEGRQFTFNGDNKQTEVKDAQNNPIGQYYYDGEGKRIKKITNTEITIFVYNVSGQLIAEYSTQTNSNPTTNYLTNDNLGSPRVITDSLGQVISRRDFMPFGEELYSGIGNRTANQKYSQNGVDNIRKRFTGYEKDTETDLDYAEARYYHNEHGRFTAVDPLLASGKSANPQTFNRYTYTINNPINLVDPTGLISQKTGANGGMNFCKYQLGCGSNPSKPFQNFDLPEELKDEIYKKKRELGNGDWWINEDNGSRTQLGSNPTITMDSLEMQNALYRDATDIYNRGLKEASLFYDAMSQIRQNQEILAKNWNGSYFFDDDNFDFSAEVGAEICLQKTKTGPCGDSDITFTREIELPYGGKLTVDQITLSFDKVREYNEYVRQTDKLIEEKGKLFLSRFGKQKTTVNSDGTVRRVRFSRLAEIIHNQTMVRARRLGNQLITK